MPYHKLKLGGELRTYQVNFPATVTLDVNSYSAEDVLDKLASICAGTTDQGLPFYVDNNQPGLKGLAYNRIMITRPDLSKPGVVQRNPIRNTLRHPATSRVFSKPKRKCPNCRGFDDECNCPTTAGHRNVHETLLDMIQAGLYTRGRRDD